MRNIILIPLLLLIGIVKIGAQVNLQTGSATFGLPIFSWQDDKSRLNANIGLSYSSGNGLRTSDVASNVGQGWNLLAGGVINRMQVGEPDDQIPYYGKYNGTLKTAAQDDYNDITRYPAGYLYNKAISVSSGIISNPGCPNVMTGYPLFRDRNHLYKPMNAFVADRELDYFTFQFNGRTGMFVLDKSTLVPNGDGSSNGTGVCLGDSKLKISFTSQVQTGIRTSIIAFSIQDENGLIYHFSKYGTTEVLKQNYCDDNFKKALAQPKFDAKNVYHEAGFEDASIVNPGIINSWYLVDIEDALTKNSDNTPRKIKFNYTGYSKIKVNAGVAISYYKESDYIVLSHSTSVDFKPYISSIDFPDRHQVIFNYGAPRVDMPGENVLGSVDITYNDNGNTRYLSKYQLNTTYFILNHYGVPASPFEKQVARLCLQSVLQYGVDVKGFNQPYIFDYYMNTRLDASGNLVKDPDAIIPPPFSAIKDIWGFFNGNKSIDYWPTTTGGSPANTVIPAKTSLSNLTFNQLKSLCYVKNITQTGPTSPILNPNDGYAQNGLLKQINYPAGGFIKYFYQQNKGAFYGASTQTTVGGVHVSETQVVDASGGSFNNCDHPMVTKYSYKASDGSASSLWGMESPVNCIYTGSHFQPADKKLHYRPLVDLSCVYRMQYPGIMAREQATSLSAHEETMMAIDEILNVISSAMIVWDIVNICLVSTGVGAIIAVALDILGILVEIALTCFSSPPHQDNTSTVYYNSDINSSNGLPCQYNRVEVSQGSSGGIGKTVFEFTDPNPDNGGYALWLTSNPLLSNAQRYAPWAYGLPLKTTVFDNSGSMVKQTLNTYDYSHAQESFTAVYPSFKCMVSHSSSGRYDDWAGTSLFNSDGSPNSNKFSTSSAQYYSSAFPLSLEVNSYNIYTGRVELSKTLERVYNASASQYVETETDYGYDINNYQVNHTVTIQSNGDMFVKDTYYSCDYATTTGTNTAATILRTLAKDNNILNAHVKTVIYKAKAVTTPNISIVSSNPDGVCNSGTLTFTATIDQSNVSILWTVNGNTITGANALTFTYFVNEGDVIVCKAKSTVSCSIEYGISNSVTIYGSCFNSNKKKSKSNSIDSVSQVQLKSYAYNTPKTSHGPNVIFDEEFYTKVSSFNELPRNIQKENAISPPCASTPYYLSETATEYQQMANGDIKPSRTLTERTAQPVPEANWVHYNPTYTTLNTAFVQVQTFKYDANGNLTGMKDEGNHTVTNIYDYNDKYVTASIINADPTIDKPAYTSFETNKFGGWTVSNTSDISSASAITGSKSFTLSSSNHISANITNSSKSYKLSFWATSTPTVSSGATQLKNAPTINGYTYYEYDIAQATATVSLTASTNLNIDELRLSPKTARMRTVSYDPLVGKTAECDENNRLTYYQYDELGRLRFTKDDYGNIIKMQEYNIATKKSGCQAIYSNNEISETFSENDCDVTDVGSDVPYTIPAGKYTSTISQLDADLQAQSELNRLGQAAANNNGTCQPLFYNDEISGTFNGDCADAEYVPTVKTTTYTVPANTYKSLVSQDDANQKAQNDVKANGQLYANQHAACVVSTDPDWVAVEPLDVTCQTDGNGHNTGYALILMHDINPNSASYGQTSVKTVIPNAAITSCPVTTYESYCQKIINGLLETGIPQTVSTDIVYVTVNGVTHQQYVMTFYYEFSDGTTSPNYTYNSSTGTLPAGCPEPSSNL